MMKTQKTRLLLLVSSLAFALAAGAEESLPPPPPEPQPPQGGPGFGPRGPRGPHGGPGGWAAMKEGCDPKQAEAMEKTRQKAEILFELARMYKQAGRLDEALAAARRIADMEVPKSDGPEGRASGKRFMIYGFMADILREKKDLDGALKVIDEGQKKASEAADLAPDIKLRTQVELLKTGARLYQDQGNVDKAAEYMQRALSLVEKP